MLNWSGNVTFAAKRLRQPRSVEDLQALVSETPSLHALGARHSFSAVADSPGVLVDLSLIDAQPAIDVAARTVTVSGGTRYRELAQVLEAKGFALANLPSFTQLSVAGAIATGTHGSGDRLATLASLAVLNCIKMTK